MLQDFPDAGPELLAAIIRSYTKGASSYLRGGIALALNAAAPQWRSQDATVALDFLLGSGFAERDDDVRSGMVDAGEQPLSLSLVICCMSYISIYLFLGHFAIELELCSCEHVVPCMLLLDFDILGKHKERQIY